MGHGLILENGVCFRFLANGRRGRWLRFFSGRMRCLRAGVVRTRTWKFWYFQLLNMSEQIWFLSEACLFPLLYGPSSFHQGIFLTES